MLNKIILIFFKVGLFKKINKVRLFINKSIKANKQKEILVPHINVERFHFINIYFLLSNNKRALLHFDFFFALYLTFNII